MGAIGVGPAIGLGTSLIGGLKGNNAQKQANAAASQDMAGINQALGTESGAINGLLQNWLGQGGGAQQLGNMMNMLGGQTGASFNDPNAQSAAGVASQLQNFQGLKPQEVEALQTTLGNSGMNTINTLRSQLGGTSNPGATIQGLLGQNSQNSLNLGTQLGGLGAQQEESALQGAGNIFQGLGGLDLSHFNDVINGILGGAGIQSGLISSGLQGLGGMQTLLGNLFTNAQKTGQTAGAGVGNAFGNIGDILGGLFPGSTGGSTSSGAGAGADNTGGTQATYTPPGQGTSSYVPPPYNPGF